MVSREPGEGGALIESAERRLRRWLSMEEMRSRRERDRTAEQVSGHIGPYVTISREAGAGGGEIAERLGERLGWDVLDKELIDFMAEHYHLPRKVLEFVDETTANWLSEQFSQLIDRHVITQQAYVKRLGSILMLAAYHGKVILVGRGAQFLLPPEKGFAVRVLAPERDRIERIARREKVDPQTATKHVGDIGRGRHDFVNRYFHQDPSDPHLYDMVVNLGKYGVTAAADMIASSVKIWLRER